MLPGAVQPGRPGGQKDETQAQSVAEQGLSQAALVNPGDFRVQCLGGQEGDPLGDGEVVPRRGPAAQAGEEGDPLQGGDDRPRAHDPGRVGVGLAFEVAHEVGEDEAEIDHQKEEHGQGDEAGHPGGLAAVAGQEPVSHRLPAQQPLDDQVAQNKGQDEVAQKKKEIEEQVAVLDVADLVGQNRPQLGLAQPLHQGRGEEQVTQRADETHHPGGEQAAPHHGPDEDLPDLDPLFGQKTQDGEPGRTRGEGAAAPGVANQQRQKEAEKDEDRRQGDRLADLALDEGLSPFWDQTLREVGGQGDQEPGEDEGQGPAELVDQVRTQPRGGPAQPALGGPGGQPDLEEVEVEDGQAAQPVQAGQFGDAGQAVDEALQAQEKNVGAEEGHGQGGQAILPAGQSRLVGLPAQDGRGQHSEAGQAEEHEQAVGRRT